MPVGVLRDEGRVLIGGRLTERVALRVIAQLSQAIKLGYEQLNLDFSSCSRAWPEGMLPIICQARAHRERGYELSTVLPQDETLRRLFLNTNWAHFLAPQQFDAYDFRTRHHLPATPYDATSQRAIVDQVVEIVMGGMEIERAVLTGLEWSITRSLTTYSSMPTRRSEVWFRWSLNVTVAGSAGWSPTRVEASWPRCGRATPRSVMMSRRLARP